ncbi:MAG: hypothetical protein H7833_09820 [Magnetococcus sp. DMHC-1]|nr:hypothetical protein [Magnetococcales bacterium]
MRFALILSLMLLLLPVESQAQEIYQKDIFTVRKLEGVCKLEIAMSLERRPVVILALFDGSKYYDELFTTRDPIGLAKGPMVLQFDQEPQIQVEFAPGLNAKDEHWEWQYLNLKKETLQLLEEVKRRRTMEVRFSNGTKEFQFSVPLKGSTKAVKAMKDCQP